MPIGMGEHVRATFRSMRAAAMLPRLTDVYRLQEPNPAEVAEFGPALTEETAAINVYHVNGNEVDQAIKHLSYREHWSGYNIIYPLWELPRYPAEWARQLDLFDEIWAPSSYIEDSLRNACSKPVVRMTLACDVHLRAMFGRRHFGIPEARYTFFFFYDLRSYTARKNPLAVINAYRKLLAQIPHAPVHLVIKVNGADTDVDGYEVLNAELGDLAGRATLISASLTYDEIKNLVRACDCFVSLHRSEGYGFGIAEAMALGKPVIATAHGGNTDFMAAHVSMHVPFVLVPVKEGEYPHHEGQVWADADCAAAALAMRKVSEDPAYGRELGRRARLHMRANFGYRAAGLRFRERIDQITAAGSR
ncbi:MAG: glycosyltransferase family 4 protein [Burkholderiales bacterium]